MNRSLRLIVCAGVLASVALVHKVAENKAETLYTVPGTANPWLSGQPAASIVAITHNGNTYIDTGITNAAVQVTDVPLIPGEWLLFGVSGQSTNGPSHPNYTPDGYSTITHNYGGAMNGLSNINAPMSSLVGVFLSDTPSQALPTPANLDFSTAESRNFTQLNPALQQVFFIGDGMDSLGNFQEFIVPAGATRLFLAVMDGYEWSNNMGSLSVNVASAIPNPAVASLLGLGGMTALGRRRRTA